MKVINLFIAFILIFSLFTGCAVKNGGDVEGKEQLTEFFDAHMADNPIDKKYEDDLKNGDKLYGEVVNEYVSAWKNELIGVKICISSSSFDSNGLAYVSIVSADESYSDVEFIIDKNGNLKEAAVTEAATAVIELEEVKNAEPEIDMKDEAIIDSDKDDSAKDKSTDINDNQSVSDININENVSNDDINADTPAINESDDNNATAKSEDDQSETDNKTADENISDDDTAKSQSADNE